MHLQLRREAERQSCRNYPALAETATQTLKLRHTPANVEPWLARLTPTTATACHPPQFARIAERLCGVHPRGSWHAMRLGSDNFSTVELDELKTLSDFYIDLGTDVVRAVYIQNDRDYRTTQQALADLATNPSGALERLQLQLQNTGSSAQVRCSSEACLAVGISKQLTAYHLAQVLQYEAEFQACALGVPVCVLF